MTTMVTDGFKFFKKWTCNLLEITALGFISSNIGVVLQLGLLRVIWSGLGIGFGPGLVLRKWLYSNLY